MNKLANLMEKNEEQQKIILHMKKTHEEVVNTLRIDLHKAGCELSDLRALFPGIRGSVVDMVKTVINKMSKIEIVMRGIMVALYGVNEAKVRLNYIMEGHDANN